MECTSAELGVSPVGVVCDAPTEHPIGRAIAHPYIRASWGAVDGEVLAGIHAVKHSVCTGRVLQLGGGHIGSICMLVVI